MSTAPRGDPGPDACDDEARLETLTPETLDTLLKIEQSAYSHPWTRGNFLDTLAAGHQVQCLWAGEVLLGYFVAMKGVDEVHLLNITVAPAFQRQGWACVLLDALALWARSEGAQWIWLEVRVSNVRAIEVYERRGFVRAGIRKAYYPAGHGLREDAVVMSLAL